MAKEDTQQSVVNPWELDWHNVNVKQDSQSLGRKAKDLGGFAVNTGRNVAGGIAKGVVGVGQAAKGVIDFVDTVTDGGMAVNPVGLGLKAYDKIAGTDNYQQLVNAQKNARQKAMNAVDNWVDNSDSFAADLARNTGFGKTTQDTKGFGNAVQQNITNYVQSQGMRDSINRRAEQNALEQQRWNALSDDEKTLGARLGHWGNIAGNVISNPLATLDDTVVSATEMVGGGRLLKGANFGLKALQGTKAGAKALGVIGGENAAKAAITEGLIAGGHNVAETKNELGDEFDKAAALKSGLSGVTTGAIALGGNRLGRALGVADIDEMLVAGAKNTAKGTGGKLGRLGAVAKGAVQEGLLEELPQGMAETALQNWATGKPITDGMAENAISGAIAGGLMGGSGAGVHYQKTPELGLGFRPASKVTAKERKKYADSIAEQQQAQAERIYSGSTDLDSEDARINQHISRQVLQGFDLGQGGQRAVDLSAMRQDLTPSNRLGLRRDYQGGGALESTAALAVDSGASFSGSLNNDEIVRSSTQNAQDTISRLGLSAYTQQNKNQSESVSGGLLPQSQLSDDLINTPTDNSVISSSGRAVRGRVGGSRGGSGATGGRNNITISNTPTSTLDGVKSLGIGQGISQSETLSEQPKLGVKGISASKSVSSEQLAVSSGSGQTITNSNALKTPTQYTAKEQKTIRRIESTPNKGRDMAVIGKDNLTPAILDYAVSNNRSIAVDTLAPKKAIALGYKHTDDVRRTISGSAITHTLNRHGKDSDLAKKGQKPVTKQHIQNWAKYADNADMQVITKDNLNQEVVISGKQINGYHLVVESIRKKGNELAFKTMYFEKGDLKNNENFKDAQTLLRGYEPDANSFASPKSPVAGSGTPSNSAYGQAVASRNPTLSQMPQQGQPVNQTVANTIPQSTEKSSGNATATQQKLSPPTNPETLKKAKAVARKNIIYVKTKTKQQAEEIAKTYGWDKTHTPRFDTISDKWVLVKNTYWDSEKSKDEKEDAVVADAVKSVQAATAKINQQVNQVQAGTPTANRSLSYQTANSKAVQPELDLTQTQSKQAYYIHTDTQREALRKAEELGVLQTHTPHKDYESGKYILVRNDLIKNPTQTQKRLMEKYQSSVSNKSVSQSKNTKDDKQDKVSGSLKDKIVVISDKVADLWVKSLGLKSLNDEYIPKIPQEVQDKIGKQIKVKKGSLLKLITRRRTKYIPEIKPTFETPDTVIKDKDGLLFIKQINDDTYFVNVNIDKGDYWVSISQSPRTIANIENKFKAGAEVLYRRSTNPKTNSPTQPVQTFTDFPSSANSNGDTSTVSVSENGSESNPTKRIQQLETQLKQLQDEYNAFRKGELYEANSQRQDAQNNDYQHSTPETRKALKEADSHYDKVMEKDIAYRQKGSAILQELHNLKMANDTQYKAEQDAQQRKEQEKIQKDKEYLEGVEKQRQQAQQAQAKKQAVIDDFLRSRFGSESALQAKKASALLNKTQKVRLPDGEVFTGSRADFLIKMAQDGFHSEDGMVRVKYDGKVSNEIAKTTKHASLENEDGDTYKITNTERAFFDWYVQSGNLKQRKSFDPATVKPATDTQIKQAVVTPVRQASNFTEARQQAKAFQGKDIVNKHANMTAVVSRNNLDKMLSAKAVGKSGNAELHALAVANVDTLFENAIYGWAKPDRDNEPSIKAVHRLFATMRTEQGDFIVKMTVKETTRTEQNNGLYTLEALEIEENTPVASWVEQHISHDNVKGVVSIRSTGAIESLIKNAQEVNNRLPETKQQTQKRLSQQLKDKANAIRESKNSVEHKNAIQQAVIDAVGLDNAKHIEIVTAAKAQAENDDLRNLSLDFVSQIEGFASADSGKITLIQSAFDSPAVAAFVAWHELGHRGIEIQGRKQWHKSLRAMMNNSQTLRRIAGKKYDLYHNQNGMRDFTAYDALEESIVDLYAAYKTGDFALFEDRNGVTLPNSWKQQGKENAILRMWNAVRAFFSRLFGRKINSDREIFALLRGLDSVQGYDFDPKSGSLKGISNNRYSLSAMKSVKANIVRGKKAMNKALTEKTDIHRAMYRNDIGWVDFVYGDKNKGLLHIFKRRLESDNMTKEEVVKMLTNQIVETVAQGETVAQTNVGNSAVLKIDYNGYRASLVKNKGSNAWLLTAFELYKGANSKGYDKTIPTDTSPTLSRTGTGALYSATGSERAETTANLPKKGIAFDKTQLANSNRTDDTQTHLRKGRGLGADSINSVSQNAGDNKRFSLASNNRALEKITEDQNFKSWFKNAHSFFTDTKTGLPKVFYRGLRDINTNKIQDIKTNPNATWIGAEFFSSKKEVADFFLYGKDTFTEQVILNAEKPFFVPYLSGKKWNNLLNGYSVSQAVKLFEKAGFNTKPRSFSKFIEYEINIANTNDTVSFYLLDRFNGRVDKLIVDRNTDNKDFSLLIDRKFNTNFFIDNLKARGKFDSVIFKGIKENAMSITSDIVAVWGTEDNQAYAKELGNKGTFSKEDKRIFYSLKNNQGATQSEFDATAKQYGGEKAYNQAKADGKTALTYKQWVQVRTPSFKAWFGDWENDPENASKVLNPDTGEPLVVYHGTEQVFTKFDITKSGENTGDSGFYGTGFYFADKKYIAEQYGKNITQSFLNIRKIFNADDFDNSKYSNLFSLEELGFPKGYTLADLNNELDTLKDSDRVSIGYEVVGKYSDGSDRYLLYVTVDGKDVINEYVSKNYIDSVKENNFNKHRIQGAVYILENKYPNAKIKSDYQIWDFGSYAVREILINNGFDGVIGGGTNAFDIGNEIVAFYPNQIKSATENKGSFDGSNPDIRFSLSPQKSVQADSKRYPVMQQIKNGKIELPKTVNGLVDWFANAQKTDKNALMARINDGLSVSDEFDKPYLYDKAGNHTLLQKLVNHTAFAGEYHLFVRDENGKKHRIEIDESNPDERLLWDFAKYTTRLHQLPITLKVKQELEQAVNKMVDEKVAQDISVLTLAELSDLTPDYEQFANDAGVTFGDKVVIIADRFDSANDLDFESTVWHELAHRGIDVQGRDAWHKWLKALAEFSPKLRKLATAKFNQYAQHKTDFTFNEALEEVIADLYGAYKTGNWEFWEIENATISNPFDFTKASEGNFIQRLWRSIKAFFSRVFGRKIDEDREIFALLRGLDGVKGYQFSPKGEVVGVPAVKTADTQHIDFENEVPFFSLKNTKPKPIKAFGENFDEYYHKGDKAVEKLLKEKHGQVVGAFYKDGIGDIDLPYGDSKVGLRKIDERHHNDFDALGGIAKGLSLIINKGLIVDEKGVKTIWHKHNGSYYLVGLSKGWFGQGENHWVVTSYKKTSGAIPAQVKSAYGDTENLSAVGKFNDEQTSSSSNAVTDNVANSMPTVKQLSGGLKAVKEVVGKDTYDLIHTMIRAENAYGQDETNPQILYSIAKTAEKARLTFGKQLGDMAKETYGKVRTPLMKVKKSKLFPSGWRVALGNKWKDSLNVQLQFLGRRHIVDIFDRVFKGRLKKYSDLVSDMDAMKNALSQKHGDLVRDWGKLPTEENDRLVALMHKATLAQYDPDTRSGKIDYTKNKDNKVIKNLDEIKALHRDFAKLSPDAKRIYRQVRDNYKEHYQRVRQAMQERILRLTDGMDNTQRKAIVEKMNNHFEDGLKGVYFPLQRFGDYVVVAKDKMGKTISVSRAESANQAEEIRREYLRDFPKDKGFSVLPVQLSKDYVQSRDGAGRAFVQNLIGEFANRPDLLDGDQFDEVADIVEQMWLASMPDLSWAKHGIHRKGTAGYSEKARRAYAANMIHGTNYLARLTYSDQLQTALDGMQEFIDNNAANEEFNHIVAQRVQNEMEKRHENLMRPNSHPLATKLTGLGFVWYLGLSPASALVNLTQTWLVGLPVIAARYQGKNLLKDSATLFNVMGELLKASKQTATGFKKDGFTFDISGSLNADEKAAFDRAVADGTIDTSQAYDLAGIADGHEDAVYFKYQRFMRGVAKMFHEAEVFNRQATFIACYRLAKQNGMNSEQAFQDAKELTYKSHFDYATSNRARILQGNWQRVIFLFKQFGFNMLYTVYRNLYVGLMSQYTNANGFTAEDRKQARRALLTMGVAHFTVAGILGLPLVGTVLSVMTMLAHAGGADDDWDAEEEMKKAFAAVLGKKGGNAMSYGLTRYLGVDLHGRLGLHDMIFPDVQENLEGQDWAESFTVGMSGAVVGMGVNFAKGLNQVHNGEVLKGAESMLPTAVRNGIKSYRLATQGQVDRTGVIVKDDFNAAEIATTAIGFNPASLRRAMEAKGEILNYENKKNKQRTALMSAFAKAYMEKDGKAMKKALAEINEWNRKNPQRRIETKNLNQSVKNRQRRITNAKHGVYLSDSHQDAYNEVDYAIVD